MHNSRRCFTWVLTGAHTQTHLGHHFSLLQEGNEETARMVTEAGCKALADTVDVTSSTSIAEGASKIRKALGEVDILINNAGVVNCAELLDLTEKAIRRVYEVNILAQYWVSEFFKVFIFFFFEAQWFFYFFFLMIQPH